MKKTLALIALLALSGCGWANVDDVKAHAVARWRELGWEVVGYEGYHWDMWWGGSYGGASVWYQLKKIPDNEITYAGYLYRWGDEYQAYGPRPLDAAIKVGN